MVSQLQVLKQVVGFLGNAKFHHKHISFVLEPNSFNLSKEFFNYNCTTEKCRLENLNLHFSSQVLFI